MSVDIHSTVYHNFYGKGEVLKVTLNNVYVLFGKKQRIFPYPDAFVKGFLSLDKDNTYASDTAQDNYEDLRPEDIKHHIMVININQTYEKDMDSKSLYNVVRGIWKESKERAEKAQYVFGVYQYRIVAVYKPTEWYVCKEAKDKLPRKDIILSPKNENRIFFIDESYEQGLSPDDNQKFYLGKTIAKLGMNKNSSNPISYLNPKEYSSETASMDPNREAVLDAADKIRYTKIYDAINAAVGSAYTGWMKATWPVDKTKLPFWIWFPKLAESKGGKMVSAANDCVNTISDDWNELVYDDLKDSPPEDENYVVPPVLIFAKEPKGGPYIFRGVYEKNREKSKHRHHVYDRIGTRVKLVGQPSGKIEILDE